MALEASRAGEDKKAEEDTGGTKSCCCPSFGSWGKTVLSWHQLLWLARWVVMEALRSRQTSAPISIMSRAFQWLHVLNTFSRLFHLDKTVGGEAKPTFTMFKLYNIPFRVNQGSSPHFPLPCTSLQNGFCQSTIVFFNIHAFPSLTWLSWHSRHNCLPR